MGQRTKIAIEVHLEEPRLKTGEKSLTMQRMIKRLKPHIGEIVVYSVVILLLTTGSYWRNKIWNSNIDLWVDCVKKSPNKTRPLNNLGVFLSNQGKYQEAILHLNEALRINPNLAKARNNLGIALAHRGKVP